MSTRQALTWSQVHKTNHLSNYQDTAHVLDCADQRNVRRPAAGRLISPKTTNNACCPSTPTRNELEGRFLCMYDKFQLGSDPQGDGSYSS